MANEKPIVASPTSAALPLTAEQLTDLLREVKKPYVDPEAEARKERHKQRMRDQVKENERMQKLKEEACGHLREDSTSAIAWMKNSDEVTRGVCQRCNTLFTPEHPDYLRLVRIPTRGAGVVYI